MERGWKNWVAIVGGMASIVVLATTFFAPVFLDGDRSGETRWTDEYRFNPWASSDGEEPMEEEASPVEAPPAEKGLWVQFVAPNDHPLETDILLSAPGMWPFVTMNTDSGGYLELPSNRSEMLDGRELQMYEIVARPDDSAGLEVANLGFWGVIHGPEEELPSRKAKTIELEEANTLNLKVVDEQGEPVEGAYVRLSRDSVGLLHLNYTTRDDGRVTFRSIPAGTYYLTLDADGYARNTVAIEHSARRSSALEVAMRDGAGLRLPHSWRGPPVQELASSSNSARSESSAMSGERLNEAGSENGYSSGDAAPDSGADDASLTGEEESPDARGRRVPVELYVATNRGSGVEGAWIEAWAEGRRIAEGRSRGNAPEILHIPDGRNVEIIATHAGWGEGTKRIGDFSAGDDFIVRLDSQLLSHSGAGDRLQWADDIEEALDVELVSDGTRWLIDTPELDSPAVQAGIERGDSLMFVRRNGASHLAVVERDGRVVEVSVP